MWLVEDIPLSFVSCCNLFCLTNKRVWLEQPRESYQLPAVLQPLLVPADKLLGQQKVKNPYIENCQSQIDLTICQGIISFGRT